MHDLFPLRVLDDLAVLRNGKHLPKSRYDDNAPVPVFGSNGLLGYTGESLNSNAAVIIGRVGANCGSVHWAPRSSWVTDNAIVAAPKSEVDTRFLYFLLKTLGLSNAASGSAQPLVTQTSLKEIHTVAPPLPEQRAIARALGAFDDKIELNRRMAKTLEEITAAIFKSWFVDFDGVEEFEESELGLVPKGWTIASLETVTSMLRRGIQPKYCDDGGVLVLNQRCIRDMTVSFSDSRRHDPEARKIDGREIQVGDVLVNSTGVGTLGRVAQVTWLDEPTIVDSHVTVVRADEDQIRPVVLATELERRQDEIACLGEGSTGQTELSRKRLGGMRVAVADRATQDRFVELAKPLRSFKGMLERESRTLATVRDTLLPKLISGKVRVPIKPEDREPSAVEAT